MKESVINQEKNNILFCAYYIMILIYTSSAGSLQFGEAMAMY